ncbi:MAG TPA: flagellar biosynthesis anti-sigma factor FlgM [Candidatus Treponema faecavium]|nr:flagellar biosynthesis anti-sigma factor FlgM [Candidatus Treponema faecavium]
MMIDKLGGLHPLDNVQNAPRVHGSERYARMGDSISVSDEAKEMAEAYYLHSIAMETPDVRADRVAEVKAKIQDPGYLSSAVIESVVDSIMTSYGI